MSKFTKRILVIILCLVQVITCQPAVFAAEQRTFVESNSNVIETEEELSTGSENVTE